MDKLSETLFRAGLALRYSKRVALSALECGAIVVVKEKRGHTHKHTTRTTPQMTTRRDTPFNNDRRWRGDGAYHPPHPGGWPRRSQREKKSTKTEREMDHLVITRSVCLLSPDIFVVLSS